MNWLETNTLYRFAPYDHHELMHDTYFILEEVVMFDEDDRSVVQKARVIFMDGQISDVIIRSSDLRHFKKIK